MGNPSKDRSHKRSSVQGKTKDPVASVPKDNLLEGAGITTNSTQKERFREQIQTPMAAEFEALYLRRVTAEFGDSLEKLRSAKDFSDATVPVLVEALRGGAQVYSEAEQKRLAESFLRDEGR